jgi:hypothetical protein
MLAYGFAPGRIELGHTRRKKGIRRTKQTGKSNAEYLRDYRERQKAKLTVVNKPGPAGAILAESFCQRVGIS